MKNETKLIDELTRIMRKYHPDIDEIYTTLEEIERQSTIVKQAEERPALGIHEVVAKKRMDELIREQLYDLNWRCYHPSIRQFILQHRWLRHLWFQQIMTPEEAEQVKQEVEIILEMPLFL